MEVFVALVKFTSYYIPDDDVIGVFFTKEKALEFLKDKIRDRECFDDFEDDSFDRKYIKRIVNELNTKSSSKSEQHLYEIKRFVVG